MDNFQDWGVWIRIRSFSLDPDPVCTERLDPEPDSVNFRPDAKPCGEVFIKWTGGRPGKAICKDSFAPEKNMSCSKTSDWAMLAESALSSSRNLSRARL